MIRILMYGLSAEWGGIETIAISILERLDKKRFHVDFLLSAGTPCAYENKITTAGGGVHYITPWGRNPIRFQMELKRFYASKPSYHYVWIHTSAASNITILTVTKRYTQARTILHSHGTSFECKNPLKRYILMHLHKRNQTKLGQLVDHAFACSAMAAAWLFGADYAQTHQVNIIKDAIDAASFRIDDEIRARYRKMLAVDRSLVLMHVGRFSLPKNQSFLLDVYRELENRKLDYRLIFIGDGEMKSDVMQKAKKYKLDKKVQFLGHREDIRQLLQAADLMVLPSLFEGLCISLIEAQAAGLPCFVSDAIPPEAAITNLVHYLSLEAGSAFWANKIAETMPKQERIDTTAEIEKANFDLKQMVHELEDLLSSNIPTFIGQAR